MASHVALRFFQTVTSIQRTTLPLLGFFGVTALLTLPAQARLGWTLEQCIKEYGEPKNTNANKVSFLTAGGRTVNILLDSKGLVQALEITPITQEEALSFKGEYGIGWVTTDKQPDYSIIPDAEWAKTRVGEMHGVEWNYFPKNKLMLMNTGAAQIFFAKEKAKSALNSPITPAPNEVATSQGVSSIRQVRRIYVESLGSDGESRLTREKIRAQLIKSKRFVVMTRPPTHRPLFRVLWQPEAIQAHTVRHLMDKDGSAKEQPIPAIAPSVCALSAPERPYGLGSLNQQRFIGVLLDWEIRTLQNPLCEI